MFPIDKVVVLLLSLVIPSTFAIALDQDVVRRSSTCVAAYIITFKSVVANQPKFCQFWQQAGVFTTLYK